MLSPPTAARGIAQPGPVMAVWSNAVPDTASSLPPVAARCRSRRPLPGLLVLAILACCGLVPVTSARAEAPPHSVADVVASVLPAVVAISATRAMPQAAQPNGAPPAVEQVSGSGFIIDPSGLIVTNKHVVQDAVAIAVTLDDGTILSADPAGASELSDIALLRVFADRKLPALRFGNSDALRAGDPVIAIGSPLGFQDTVTTGVVSGLNRNIMESPFDNYIQTDAAINHGNSGGPLFDLDGDVIGMNSVIFAPGGYGGSIGLAFAIPSNDVQFVTDRLRRFGRVDPGWIGVRYQQVTPQLQLSLGLTHRGGGAIMVGVVPDSPAASAGLRPGDVVLGFDGQDLPDARALARAVAKTPFGKTVTLSVWRDGVVLNLPVTVMQMPDRRSVTAATDAPGPNKADAAGPNPQGRPGATGVAESGAKLGAAGRGEAAPEGGSGPVAGRGKSGDRGARVDADADNEAGRNDQARAAAATIPLGLSLSVLDDRMAHGLPPGQHGVLVSGVAPGSAAAEAGLNQGDVIVMLWRDRVDTPASVMHSLRAVREDGRRFAAMLVTHEGQARWVALYVPPDVGAQRSEAACDGLPGPACQVSAAASQDSAAGGGTLRPPSAAASN
jgi:serine protease Do